MIVARHLRGAGARSRCSDLTDRRERSSSSLNAGETWARLGPGGHSRTKHPLPRWRARVFGGWSRSWYGVYLPTIAPLRAGRAEEAALSSSGQLVQNALGLALSSALRRLRSCLMMMTTAPLGTAGHIPRNSGVHASPITLFVRLYRSTDMSRTKRHDSAALPSSASCPLSSQSDFQTIQVLCSFVSSKDTRGGARGNTDRIDSPLAPFVLSSWLSRSLALALALSRFLVRFFF